MDYRLVLLIPLINSAPLVGKCACHENVPQQAPVKPAAEPANVPAPMQEPSVIHAPSVASPIIPESPVATEPVIIPNTHVEPTVPVKEVESHVETAPAVPEVEKTEDLRTTIQRAAVLCAAIGVVGLILYKSVGSSPLERAVSGLERTAAAR